MESQHQLVELLVLVVVRLVEDLLVLLQVVVEVRWSRSIRQSAQGLHVVHIHEVHHDTLQVQHSRLHEQYYMEYIMK